MSNVDGIARQFAIKGSIEYIDKLNSGHINNTFLVATDEEKYVLQGINTYVFPDYQRLMDNFVIVTEFLNKSREGIGLIPTKTGEKYLIDNGVPYRMTNYIVGECLDKPTRSADLFIVGKAYGDFQKALAKLDPHLIKDIIPDFHNTPSRFEKLLKSEKACKNSDRKEMAREIFEEFFKRKKLCDIVTSKLNSGEIPYRVTHNDTKINNVIIDSNKGMPICVIDLDTVMQGSLLYDFGDALRTGGVKTDEDCEKYDLIEFDLEYFRQFCVGFFGGTKDMLTAGEKEHLVDSVILLTYECGMRFLTDFYDNDVYFRCSKPNHNLIRAKTQLALIIDLEKKYEKMTEIVYEELAR